MQLKHANANLALKHQKHPPKVHPFYLSIRTTRDHLHWHCKFDMDEREVEAAKHVLFEKLRLYDVYMGPVCMCMQLSKIYKMKVH